MREGEQQTARSKVEHRRKIRKVAHPVSPRGEKAREIAEGVLRPDIKAAFLWIASRKLDHARRKRHEEAKTSKDPDQDRARTRRSCGRYPTQAQPAGTIEEREIEKSQIAFQEPLVVTPRNSHRELSRSRRTAIAALRPLMPMTLPPGCVHAPHRYTPSIGVLAAKRLLHIYAGRHSPWKMCPPVSPTFCSISGGPSTCTSTTASDRLLQKRPIECSASSRAALRCSSQLPDSNA